VQEPIPMEEKSRSEKQIKRVKPFDVTKSLLSVVSFTLLQFKFTPQPFVGDSVDSRRA